MSDNKLKRILLVEDDLSLMQEFRKIISKYNNDVVLIGTQNAGEALNELHLSIENNQHFSAVILDIMMPYGSAIDELKGGNDLEEIRTGLKLLDSIRREEKARNLDPLWISIITARSPLAIDAEAIKLLAGYGKVYIKPFDTDVFEDDLMKAICVPSQVLDLVLPGALMIGGEMEDEI